MKPLFKLKAPFAPAGDQPLAIEKLVDQRGGISTLLGVTGSVRPTRLPTLLHSRISLCLFCRLIKH